MAKRASLKVGGLEYVENSLRLPHIGGGHSHCVLEFGFTRHGVAQTNFLSIKKTTRSFEILRMVELGGPCANRGGLGEGIAYAAGNVGRTTGLISVLFEASKKELNNPPMRFAPMQRTCAKVLKLPIVEVVHCQ